MHDNLFEPLPHVPAGRPSALSSSELVRPVVLDAPAEIALPGEGFLARFEYFARTTPAATAVSFGDRQLSYAELDARAARLATFLSALGVREERAVAVCLKPSLEVVIAIVAIFKAQGVYVPLDPAYPRALLAGIVAEAAPVCALTDSACAGAELPEELRRFRFDSDWSLTEGLAPLRARAGSPRQASHVFYTSGTTGKPKGVVATQANLAHYLRAARDRYGFSASDVFCSLARYTFSISLFELLSPLSCGGSLILLAREEVLDPARLCRALSRATVVHAGPSLLTSLVRYLETSGAAAPVNLRHLSSGGDLVPPQLLLQLRKIFQRSEIFVIYGCTEVSCMGATYELTPSAQPATCLVGKAFAGMTLRILDEQRRPVGLEAVGELYFAGAGVTARYLERPELTSERFVEIDGLRFYRTGDLGRLTRDGNVEILGRSDFQVQVRGMRVELNGIEHTARRLGLAEQCAVVAVQKDENDVRLCAFVVGARVLEVSGLRKALARELPDYMLPQQLIALDAMPLTPNGKLDRRRLIELAREAAAPAGGAESAPESDLEYAIAQAFASVLGVASVPVEQSFFDLGGHSLLAVMLMEELKNRLGMALSPELVFEHESVRALARVAGDSSEREQRPILLSQRAEHPPVFALLGVHLYKELARALEGRFSVYGVFAGQELSLLDGQAQGASVEELAQIYLALIRRVQPHGPYRLIGMSFGGVVAYEVAQALRAAGEEVETLGMLDSVLPETRLAKLQRLLLLPGRALASELSERVKSRLFAQPEAAPSLFVRESGDARVDQLEEQRQRAYRAAARAYLSHVRPYPGSAFLVVSGQRLSRGRLQNPRCGWESWVPALEVHTVDSDHLGILEKPSVERVAGFLIAQAEGAARATAKVA